MTRVHRHDIELTFLCFLGIFVVWLFLEFASVQEENWPPMTARLPARDVGVRRRVVRHTVGARGRSIGFARGGRGFARHTGQDSARQDGAGQPQMRVTEPHCRGDRAAVQSGRLQSEQMPVQRPCCRSLDRRGTDRLPRCPLHADNGASERRQPAGEHAVRRQVHFPGSPAFGSGAFLASWPGTTCAIYGPSGQTVFQIQVSVIAPRAPSGHDACAVVTAAAHELVSR